MTTTPDWLTPDLEIGIGKFIDDRDLPPEPRLTLDAALQVIVRDWLQAQGFLPLPDGDAVVPLRETNSLSSDPAPTTRVGEP